MLVKVGADFLELVLQVVVGPLHRLGVIAIDRFTHRGNGVFDLLLLIAGMELAQFLNGPDRETRWRGALADNVQWDLRHNAPFFKWRFIPKFIAKSLRRR